MTDQNRYFPVLSKDADNAQIGWSLVEYGKIAIVLNEGLVPPMIESRVEEEDLIALYLDLELKSFSTRRPIRGMKKP